MATKAFDPSKFRNSLTKSIKGMSAGFNDPTDWISTGNYALNYLLSGDFKKGIPLGKVSVFAGESGAGKSYIVSGNIVKHAQEQGIFVVLIDSENALDESWLQALGVDTNENQFEAGDMKGDMGRKAKALKALVTNCVNMFGSYNVGMVVTNHTYASQDMFDPDDKISGGSGFVYASSMVVAMKKLKLKEDEDGNKTSEVNGIRAACKVMKTRYAKPFEGVQVKIPYETGMDPYSGLFDMFEKWGVLEKQGNRYKYTDSEGIETLEYRKNWTGELLEMVMSDLPNKKQVEVNIENTNEEVVDTIEE